jgi:serine/threonine protein kinase
MAAMSQSFCPNCFAASYGGGKCGKCGYIAIQMRQNDMALPSGTVLNGEYLLGRVLGIGGFGVTYIAKELKTGNVRAIKEYFPSALAARSATGRIMANKSDSRAAFEHGLNVFGNEAEMLGKFFGEQRIVQVYGRFLENDTAYFVMEYLDGLNVRALAKNMGGAVPLDFAAEILMNTAEALRNVHGQGLLHRDVSPENIFLTKDGRIKLIDFGATRYFVGEMSKSLSIILKPGFAPPEQYSSKGNQGPWTDIYALAATFYSIVSGKRLPEAPDRLSGKPLPLLNELVASVSPAISNAVDRALRLNYRDRFQTMDAFLSAVETGGAAAGPATAPAPARGKPAEPGVDAGSIKNNPCISVVGGPFAGNKWTIPQNMDIMIGRSSEFCNIVIDDVNISRKHCVIRYDVRDGRFYLMDLSSNGTFDPAGNRYRKGEWAVLPPESSFFLSTADYRIRVDLE